MNCRLGDTFKSLDKLKRVVLGSLQMKYGRVVGLAGESIPFDTEAFGHAEEEDLDMFDWSRIYISFSVKERSKSRQRMVTMVCSIEI